MKPSKVTVEVEVKVTKIEIALNEKESLTIDALKSDGSVDVLSKEYNPSNHPWIRPANEQTKDTEKGLDIRDACRYAIAQGKYITRRMSGGVIGYKIHPSDDPFWLCSMMRPDGSEKAKRWQPSLEDLIATNWEVVD